MFKSKLCNLKGWNFCNMWETIRCLMGGLDHDVPRGGVASLFQRVRWSVHSTIIISSQWSEDKLLQVHNETTGCSIDQLSLRCPRTFDRKMYDGLLQFLAVRPAPRGSCIESQVPTCYSPMIDQMVWSHLPVLSRRHNWSCVH